jgi:hypothetical protein
MATKFVTNLDLNQNELQNAAIQNLASAPVSPTTGQIYYNTSNDTLFLYNGTSWTDLSGDIQSIIAGTGLDGGGNDGDVTIDLADTSVTPGSYGSATAIPSFTVDQQGRLTAASEVSVATILNISADTGTDGVSLLSDTLNFTGGVGVTTVASDNDIEIYIGQDVGTSASVTFAEVETTGNVTIGGDLTVNGTTTTVNSTTVTIDDPIFTLGGDSTPSSDDDKDRGIEFKWHDGASAKVGFFGYDDSTGRFTFIPDSTNTSEVFSGTLGDVDFSAYYVNGTEVLSDTVDLPVAYGGTGASTAANARDNLAETSSSGLTTSTPTLARVAAQDCAASAGSTSTTTVTHNMGSSDVIVQVFEAATNATVVADVVRTSIDVVTVTINGASISSGDYRIVVTG